LAGLSLLLTLKRDVEAYEQPWTLGMRHWTPGVGEGGDGQAADINDGSGVMCGPVGGSRHQARGREAMVERWTSTMAQAVASQTRVSGSQAVREGDDRSGASGWSGAQETAGEGG
jgi:hypothetical protein